MKLEADQQAERAKIVAECQRYQLPIEQVAYVLATAWGESKLRPVEENLSYTAKRIGEVWPRLKPRAAELARNPEKLANAAYAGRIGNGNEASGDGWRFRGRGMVQLTGRANYRKFGIEAAPDQALSQSEKILVRGMVEGMFTGRQLSDYVPGDFVGARRIVNGTFEAERYAGYAREFLARLRREGYNTAPPAP